MPTASIGLNGLAAGKADLSINVGDTITLVDLAGDDPDSRQWSVQRWPAPLAAAPVFSPDAVSTTVTFAAPTANSAGCYLINLTRVDNGVTTSAQVLAGVLNDQGFLIPCAGLSGILFDTVAGGLAAQEEGWQGHARSSTNFIFDAVIRYLLGSSFVDQTSYRGILENTDNASTVVQAITQADLTTVAYLLIAIGRDSVSGEGAFYVSLRVYDRNAGAPALITGGSTDIIVAEDDAAWDVDLVVNGNNLDLTIVPDGTNDTDWKWVVLPLTLAEGAPAYQ